LPVTFIIPVHGRSESLSVGMIFWGKISSPLLSPNEEGVHYVSNFGISKVYDNMKKEGV
jgi:hypothetical protein